MCNTVCNTASNPPTAAPEERTAVVHTTLTYAGPPTKTIRIEMHVDLPCPQVLVMPRAIPMGYGEAPYDRFVRNVTAWADDGEQLAVRRAPRGPRWQLGENGTRLARLHYDVEIDAMEQAILAASDTSKCRAGYVGLLGYSVFAYLDGQEAEPIDLEVRGPENWPVFTTLAPAAPPAKGRATARAADFYALADAQIAMGEDLRVRRVDAAVPLFVAVYAETEVDDARIAKLAREALDPLVKWFGSAPFAHYTVLQEYLKPRTAAHRYGFSMEHMDSGTFFLDVDRALTAKTSAAEIERTRYNFAHHIAHSWIPKRCYGKGYFPFTWELAPVLDSIWFSEGWGQYAAMAALADVRKDGDAWLQRMVRRRFGRGIQLSPHFLNRMSLVEVSRIASTRYSSDFRTGFNVFSRGGMMAAEIDQAIRRATKGEKSLRELARYLVTWSAREKKHLPLEQLPKMCEKATGVDVSAIYKKWLGPVR